MGLSGELTPFHNCVAPFRHRQPHKDVRVVLLYGELTLSVPQHHCLPSLTCGELE